MNGIKGPPHEYFVVRQSVPYPRSPSPSVLDLSAPTGPSTPPADCSMDSSRSGLPPPSSLALPPPDVGFTPMATMNQQLPPPPTQWPNSDEAMHHWLRAKAEEDRRRQEEEKTRQETLRLEQRRVEQSMLRDSLNAGVPPHMIPLIFAGLSQGGLPQPILDFTQQYLAHSPEARTPASQLPSQSHSHSHSHSQSYSQRRHPHSRRGSRSIPPNSYAPQQAVPGSSVLLSQPLHSNVIGTPSTPQSLGRQSVSSGTDSRAATSSRMNSTGSQNPPAPINLSNVQYAPGSSVPPPQASGKPDPQSRQSPPSLYFHHWVPPGQSHSNTPSARPHQESPIGHVTPRRPEHPSSPGRKRKAMGHHQPAPLPSSRPSEPLHGPSQSPRPGSPVTGGRQTIPSTHRHQPSDTPLSYEPRFPDHVELDRTSTNSAQSVPRTVPPMDISGLERSQDPSAPAISRPFPNPHRVLQPPYESSAETAPPDSDLDSSPRRSPVISTQPGATSGG